MNFQDLTKVLTARARRSIRRGFNSETTLFFERMRSTAPRKGRPHPLSRRARATEHIGRHVAIHNGKEFKEIEIGRNDRALLRRICAHSPVREALGPGRDRREPRSSKFMPLK